MAAMSIMMVCQKVTTNMVTDVFISIPNIQPSKSLAEDYDVYTPIRGVYEKLFKMLLMTTGWSRLFRDRTSIGDRRDYTKVGQQIRTELWRMV